MACARSAARAVTATRIMAFVAGASRRLKGLWYLGTVLWNCDGKEMTYEFRDTEWFLGSSQVDSADRSSQPGDGPPPPIVCPCNRHVIDTHRDHIHTCKIKDAHWQQEGRTRDIAPGKRPDTKNSRADPQTLSTSQEEL